MATQRPEMLVGVLRSEMTCRYRGRERFDDAAIRDRAATALRDHPIELAAQRTKIGNLPINLMPMRACDRIDRIARPASIVRKIQQRADLIERKAEVARAADEAQPVEMLLAIGSVVPCSAAWFRDDADLFIEPDRLDLSTRIARQIADCEWPIHGLDPVVTIGCTYMVNSSLSR